MKKHEGVLEDANNKTVASQIQTINLGEGSPFETLHNYVHNSFGPYFRSYIKKMSQSQSDQQLGKSSLHSIY